MTKYHCLSVWLLPVYNLADYKQPMPCRSFFFPSFHLSAGIFLYLNLYSISFFSFILLSLNSMKGFVCLSVCFSPIHCIINISMFRLRHQNESQVNYNKCLGNPKFLMTISISSKALKTSWSVRHVTSHISKKYLANLRHYNESL